MLHPPSPAQAAPGPDESARLSAAIKQGSQGPSPVPGAGLRGRKHLRHNDVVKSMGLDSAGAGAQGGAVLPAAPDPSRALIRHRLIGTGRGAPSIRRGGAARVRARHPGPDRPAHPGERPGHRGRPEHQAQPDPRRRPAAPGQPARRRDDRDPHGPPPGAAGGGAARPSCSRSPTPAGAPSSTPTTTWPPARCASWPSAAGPDAVAEFARRQVADLERRYRPGGRRAPPRATGSRPWPRRCPPTATPPRRAALLPGRGRGPAAAALPAPLPGGARGRRVPPAVRGRDGGVRPAARHPRAAPGHHRARRRGLHHPRHRTPALLNTRTTPQPNTNRRHLRMTDDRAPGARGARPIQVRLGRLGRRWRGRPPRPVRGGRPRHLGLRRTSRSGCSTCG